MPVNDKNIFLVLATMVPGKKIELNEGVKLLTGKPKIDVPLKKKAEPAAPASAPTGTATVSPAFAGPVTTRCTVDENGVKRTFTITVEPANGGRTQGATAGAPAAIPTSGNGGTPVYSTFAGAVEVVDIVVKAGDSVTKGQVIAAVEAMKAKHDIKAPRDGKVSTINVKIGDEIDSSKPILTLA